MLIIDRFEGDFALIETSNGIVNIPKVDIPADSKEGDVLFLQIDTIATSKRNKNIDNMMMDLFKD